MGMVDGGIGGGGYSCGCWSFAGGGMRFCENPSHKLYPCGCYNIGGNNVRCGKHMAIRIAIGTCIGIALWLIVPLIIR